jgi:RES domain-containing protein
MELTPPETLLRWTAAPRLIPSRYPTVGLLDRVASSDDLQALFELEGWTNDRISSELGLIQTIARDEWVTGQPLASVVMAAFCHPPPGGSRFSSAERGAWYAARSIDTALAESAFRRTQELREVGAFETRVEMRVYLADFRARFHDVRGNRRAWHALYDRDDYSAGQALARMLVDDGSNGIVYRSVRHHGGECLACFRPALVKNARSGGHYEFRWEGRDQPQIRILKG